ncbi:hypothetical protein [Paraglaciecola aestuariivivens]
MLKSYAVALVLATSTPVAVKSEQTVQAPESNKVVTTKVETNKKGVKTGKYW